MSHARKVAVRGTAELDQFEEAFLGVFAAKNPEAIAIALRTFSCHLHSWSHSYICGAALDLMDERATAHALELRWISRAD